MDTKLKTQFEMKGIIERCLQECEDAGYIKEITYTIETGEAVPKKMLVSINDICDHISKTLIGELLEFEIIRKMGPMYRTFSSIERDLELVQAKQTFENSIPSLRIGTK